MATYVRIRWLRTRTLRSTTSECTCPSPLVVPEGRIVCARACVRTRGVRVANGDARARMGERTTRVRMYVRTYVRTYTRGECAGESTHARKIRTYVRTCVRWSTYVRAYVRAKEGTHATKIRWSTYVRTDVASGATESCGSHGRERHYVRTYVRTYLRTYVRKGGRLYFLEPPLSSYRIGKSRDVHTYVRWVCTK